MKQTTHSRKQVKSKLKSLQPLCGDCSGLKKECLVPNNSETCCKLGKVGTSKTCQYFMSDHEPLKVVARTDSFESLIAMFKDLPTDALRNVASVLYQEHKTRRFGFFFGQKVYVRYRGTLGANYLSNFMIARVLSVNAEFIRLTSDDGRCTLTYTLQVLKEGGVIYKPNEFSTLRENMMSRGRLVDPHVERNTAKRLRCEEAYELNLTNESQNGVVTTIDTVFKESKLPRRKGKRTVDLIDLVNSMEHGHDVAKDSKTYVKARRSGDRTLDVSGE
jgi:hypothetical protein